MTGASDHGLIRLWTWQGSEFPITSGEQRIDWSKSEFADTCTIQRAYRQLASRLGTDQYIWCFTDEHLATWPSGNRVRWDLEVPDELVLAYTCDRIWQLLIRRNTYTCVQRNEWKQEAISKGLLHSNDYKPYIDDKLREFQSQFQTESNLWEHLFLDRPIRKDVSALVRYPVPDEWVLGQSR